MITGFSAPDFPFAKIPTEEIARKMLDQYPQWSEMLRTTGEGSQDFNFFQASDRAYIDGFLNLAKYLDVPVIVVLNDYWSLMYQKYGATYKDKAEIARKSNLAIMNEVLRQGVSVYAVAINNECYAKNELIGWSVDAFNKPQWTRNTVANIDAMNRAVDAYMRLFVGYQMETAFRYKYAANMATDLNLARKTWDSRLYLHMDKQYDILDAHIYPSRTLTQLALETLIKKRLGRGFSTGAEIICGEVNLDFGMYGTGTIDPYARSAKHLSQLQAVLAEIGKYAKAACVHKFGSIQPNNYSMIQFTI